MLVSFHHWLGMPMASDLLQGLGDDCVQIWLAEVPACPTELATAARMLDDAERLRAERFVPPPARHEFIFGRALLRRLLAACLNTDPPQVAIGYGVHGKPRLMNGSADIDLRFNLAHSESLIAVALTRGREVGIDIEWTLRPLDWTLTAERVFSANELCHLRSLPASQQSLAFLTGWTRKEAFLKATGEGLSDRISSIELAFATPQPNSSAVIHQLRGSNPSSMQPNSPLRFTTSNQRSQSWEIHQIPLPPGFCGALVVEDPA